MKKISQLIAIIITTVTLLGCGNEGSKKSNVTANKIVASKRKAMTKKQTKTTKISQQNKDNKPIKKATSAMNFVQIKKGDYNSLLGKWKLVASAYNTYHGEGIQWHKLNSKDTRLTKKNQYKGLVITKKKIIFNQDVVFHGNTMKDTTYGKLKRKANFTESRGCLIESFDGKGYWWSIEFWPKNVPISGNNELYKNCPATIDIKKDRIWISTNNMGHTSVFQRVN